MADEIEVIPVSTAKPGVKTTEFYLSALAMVLGVVLIVLGVLKTNERLIEIGAILSGVSNVSYGIARGLAKRDVPLVESK